VTCHGCGHTYAQHQPACTTDCDCRGFRWVDPTPAAEVWGYRTDPGPVAFRRP
jgi:hypothetical protein